MGYVADESLEPIWKVVGRVDDPTHRLDGQPVSEKLMAVDAETARENANEAAAFAGFVLSIERVELFRTVEQQLDSRNRARANRARRA